MLDLRSQCSRGLSEEYSLQAAFVIRRRHDLHLKINSNLERLMTENVVSVTCEKFPISFTNHYCVLPGKSNTSSKSFQYPHCLLQPQLHRVPCHSWNGQPFGSHSL